MGEVGIAVEDWVVVAVETVEIMAVADAVLDVTVAVTDFPKASAFVSVVTEVV